MGDQDPASGLDHLGVEPRLAFGRLDLRHVEKDGPLAELVAKEAQVAVRRAALARVEEEDQHLPGFGQRLLDSLEQPALLGRAPARREGLALGDQDLAHLLRVLQPERREIVRAAVEV